MYTAFLIYRILAPEIQFDFFKYMNTCNIFPFFSPPNSEDIADLLKTTPMTPYVSQDSGHHAPDTLGYDPLLPQFTAAWFKLYLDRTPEWEGIDFRSMIVGNDEKRSICKGGFGVMVEKMCTFKER